MDQTDTAGLILSYLPNKTLAVLHSLGVTPTLSVNARDQMFWKRRVETLLKKDLPSSLARDWKRIYQSLVKRRNTMYLRDVSDNIEAIQVLSYIGVTPSEGDLYFAVETNSVNLLSFIIQEGSLNLNTQRNGLRRTPLMVAAQYGSLDSVVLLLQDGRVDINLHSLDLTALGYACQAWELSVRVEKYEKIVSLLLADKRLDPNTDWEEIWEYATDERDKEGIVKLLLQDERATPPNWLDIIEMCVSSAAINSLTAILQAIPSEAVDWDQVAEIIEDSDPNERQYLLSIIEDKRR